MASDYGEINREGSASQLPSPTHAYFMEQLRFGSYMGPELRRTRDHDQLSPHPHPHPHPHLRPFFPYAHDMQEAIQREIEKERIREEIIMSELRRRELEAEVRRELMLERELGLGLRRGRDGLPFVSPSIIGFDFPMRLPAMVQPRAEGGPLQKPLPFQRGSADAQISVRPVSLGAKQKENNILLAKTSECISGVKRGAHAFAAGKPLSESSMRKKTKEEWSCAVCQVSSTSEQALNEHLRGKKHKMNEAGLKTQAGGKNYVIGFYLKKASKATTVDHASSDHEVKVASQSLPSDNQLLLEDSPNSKNEKKNMQKGQNLLKKKFRFWCEVCQIGCHTMKVLNTHLKGKKHRRRVDVRGKNCGGGPSEEKSDHVLTGADVGGEHRDGEGVVS